MTGMVEKVKAKVDGVLHKDHKTEDPTGPHSSHAANQADPRVDSDRYGAAGNTGSAAHGTTHTGTTGTHTGMTGSHVGSTGTDPTGPHDSHMANKADPRVDSDRIGATGNTHGTTHTGTTGMTGVTGSDPSGPHDSRMANKADPRVDSDRYGSAGNHTGMTGTTGTHTGAHTGTTGMTGPHTGMAGSDPTGPHDSRMANKADPRVDSDRYGSAGNYGSAAHGTTGTTGMTGTHAGTTGTHTGTTGSHTGMTGTHAGTHTGMTGSDPTGPHDSHLANKADLRVDSDRYGSAGNYGSAAHGTTGTTGMTGTHAGTTGTHTGNLAHRDNETGDLPKALVEPQSHAVPHSSTQTGNHTHGTTGVPGTHGTTHGTSDVHGTHGTTGKPSMMDKLNPKKDADFDGKRGVMD